MTAESIAKTLDGREADGSCIAHRSAHNNCGSSLPIRIARPLQGFDCDDLLIARSSHSVGQVS
jgi:hypothetical protein